MRVMMSGFRHLLPLTILLLLLYSPLVQASFEYAAACIPGVLGGSLPMCQLNILARKDSKIEIRTFDANETFSLSAGSLYKQWFQYTFLPKNNTDNKAIRVTSDKEIQVLVYFEDNPSNFQDVYMVPNQLRNGNTYYTSAYFRNDARRCSSFEFKQFYLVSSIYDETTISVKQQDGITYDLELPEFGTFLQKTQALDNNLAMGTRITSNKPITVVAGNLCVNNMAIDVSMPGTYLSTMPEISSSAKDYIVPYIMSDSAYTPPGYSVGVVATVNDTIVSSSHGEMRPLNQAETAFFEYPYTQESIKFSCTKPCIVTQYTKVFQFEYGLVMNTILPLNQFSTSAFFTTVDSHPASNSFLSLVLQGESPGDDVYLNGTSLGNLIWTPIEGYSTTEVEIPKGAYELISVDERPFAAYIYEQTYFRGGAFSYEFLPSAPSMVTAEPTTTNQSPTTTEPTPTPSVNGTIPKLTVSINGTAYSMDGEEISMSCVLAHSNNLDQRAKDMVVRVNAEIGKSICGSAQYIIVVSSLAAMFKQYNKMLLEVYHVMRVQGHDVPSDVETCALEVAGYLNDISNWQYPIVPDEPGCSRLEIQPLYFKTSATYWNCDIKLNEETSHADKTLSYPSKVSEVLSTQDGSALDVDCTRSYISEVSKKTSRMIGEITAALDDYGCNDIVMSVTHAESFVAAGAQASFQASFYYIPIVTSSFSEFMVCMEQVHAFSLQHQNWSPGRQPGAPFLPVPPGCPALDHTTDTLDDGGHKWTCG